MVNFIRQFNIFLKSSFSVKGRNDLFKLIWDNYHRKIIIFIKSMIKNNPVYVEDIAQDIMLKVYNNLHTYKPFYSFNTWIYSIARNHCIDFRKKKSAADSNSSELLDTVNVNQTNSYSAPDEAVVTDELNGCINSYLNTLNDADRQISFLRFYEGLGYKEIGKIMNISTGTIKYRVHVIRNNLKTFLEKHYE